MTKAFSPASLAKGYLRAMGVRPVLERQPDFPREALGIGMLSYFGGRAECHVRRLAVPVRYLDFRSMYPTVNALMSLWALATAERIEVVDATDEAWALLSQVSVERVLDPHFWRSLVGFVELVPDRATLPVRAPYEKGSRATQIGVNRVSADQPLWVTLPDAVAAALLDGRTPTIRRAIRLVPQDGRLGSHRSHCAARRRSTRSQVTSSARSSRSGSASSPGPISTRPSASAKVSRSRRPATARPTACSPR
jgi:hypothetical protein